MTKTNFEVALAAETKRVARCFHHYTTDQVCTLAGRRGGRRSRKYIDRGEFFYMHPDVQDRAFPTRKCAAEAALRAANSR